jgi:hypothetical protein
VMERFTPYWPTGAHRSHPLTDIGGAVIGARRRRVWRCCCRDRPCRTTAVRPGVG